MHQSPGIIAFPTACLRSTQRGLFLFLCFSSPLFTACGREVEQRSAFGVSKLCDQPDDRILSTSSPHTPATPYQSPHSTAPVLHGLAHVLFQRRIVFACGLHHAEPQGILH